MPKNHPAKKLPRTPPPAKGPRADGAARIVALRVGGDPAAFEVASLEPKERLAERNRIAQLARYWGGRMERRFTTRQMKGMIVVYRIA